MFGIFAKLLSSIAAFLFPIFASYKALRTSDPAQLTPWLMYWVVLSCCLLVESWTEWILVWIPFYAYLRLLFLLYLVLPQTQGARFLYETYIHPWLQDNESQIDNLITRAHSRLRTAGIAYLKQAIDMLKTKVLGLPPGEPTPDPTLVSSTSSPDSQSYTQTLLSRFSIPAARWTSSTPTSAGFEFYNLLAGAVSSLGAGASGTHTTSEPDMISSRTSTLIPSNILDPWEKLSFITAQRARLKMVLGALDLEARELQHKGSTRAKDGASDTGVSSLSLDGEDGVSGSEDHILPRPPSGMSAISGFSGLGKSRSEADFEKIDAESGAEEEESGLRRRAAGVASADNDLPSPSPLVAEQQRTSGSWLPWGWTASPSSGNGAVRSGLDT